MFWRAGSLNTLFVKTGFLKDISDNFPVGWVKKFLLAARVYNEKTEDWGHSIGPFVTANGVPV